MQRRTILKGIGAILAAPLAWLGRVEAGESSNTGDLLPALVFTPYLRLRYAGPAKDNEAAWGVIRDRFAFQGACNALPWRGVPRESCRYIGCSWVQGESAIATFAAGSPFVRWETGLPVTAHGAADETYLITSAQRRRMYESTDFNTIFKPGEWEVCDG